MIPEELTALLRTELGRWGKLAKAIGVYGGVNTNPVESL